MDCSVKLGVVFRAAVARRHDVRADGNTDKQVGHEVDERGVRTYRGKRVIACINLKPRKMVGIMSEGMLLSAFTPTADGGEELRLLSTEDIMPGGSEVG